MSRNIEFHPTLIIGLGGTGHGILLKLKKRFIDRFGAVPPIIQFLAIDTSQEAESQDSTSDKKTDVELKPNDEHYIIRVEDAANLLRGKNPHINEWWPKGTRITAITSGSKQMRAVGRLALFSAQKEIKRRITQKLDEIRKIENMNQMQEEGFRVSTGKGLEVYVVTSLAGGTGSGMFIDFSFITRNIVHYSSLTGIFVLPRVFGQFSGTDLVKTNTYTALKEIEYLSKLRDNETFDVNYGINKVPVNQPPFDMIYIIDSINEVDTVIEKDKTLHSQIADGIYLLVGSEIGAGSSNAMDNIKSHIASAGLVESRYSGYCSFGVTSCTWKVSEFKANLQNARNASSRELIQALLGSSSNIEEVKADALVLTQKCSIKKDRIKDLFDELGSPRNNTLEPFIDKAKRIPRDSNLNSTIRANYSQHLEEVEKQAKENANFNNGRLKTQFTNEFNAWQNERISRSDFLSYLSNFTQELGEVINYANDVARDSLKRAERDFNAIKSEEQAQTAVKGKSGFLQAVKVFFAGLFAGAANVDDIIITYADRINRQSRAKEKMIYSEKASDLLSELQKEVDNASAVCRQFRVRLNELQDRLKAHQKEPASAESEEGNPFVRVLPYCPPVEPRKVSLTEFSDWCAEKNLLMSDFVRASGENISKIIDGFICEHYKEDRERTINDVLKYKENDAFIKNQELLNYLSRQAAPLWRYRETEIPQTQYRVEKIAYCGVPNGESSPIKNLKSGWLGGKEPQFITTIDRDRITFFNITSGVPLFALADLKEMKEEYDANNRRVCHLDSRWQNLPDLFPASIDSLICFAVAQAPGFRFIRKNGKGRYAIYIDQQQERLLERGLEESFNEFQRKPENVERVIQAITYKLGSQDRQITINNLDSHKKHLAGLINNNGLSPSSIEFIRREVQAIDGYLRDF